MPTVESVVVVVVVGGGGGGGVAVVSVVVFVFGKDQMLEGQDSVKKYLLRQKLQCFRVWSILKTIKLRLA